MVYDKCKVYGPYTSKQDGRMRCVLVHPCGRKQTISYPKYLVEKYLNHYLGDDMTVDHIDGDITNNDLSNLRVVSRNVHSEQDAIQVSDITVTCIYCTKSFAISGSKLRYRNRRKSSGFCSKVCSGKYGSDVRYGKMLPKTSTLEFDKVYYTQKSALGEIPNVEEQNIGETLTHNGDGNTEA